MSLLRNTVPIKTVLPKYIGEEKSDLYLKGLNFAYIDSQDIYEKCLDSLIKGDNNQCLKIMIFGLDRDRSYTPLLNLCRTMLFGLSDLIKTTDFEKYKYKYKSFKDQKSSLLKKIDDLNKKINDLESKLENIREQSEELKPTSFISRKLYFIYRFALRRAEPSKQQYIFEKKNSALVVEKLHEEITNLDKLIEVEDVIQILKLIVEVCSTPIRFEWTLSNSN